MWRTTLAKERVGWLVYVASAPKNRSANLAPLGPHKAAPTSPLVRVNEADQWLKAWSGLSHIPRLFYLQLRGGLFPDHRPMDLGLKFFVLSLVLFECSLPNVRISGSALRCGPTCPWSDTWS